MELSSEIVLPARGGAHRKTPGDPYSSRKLISKDEWIPQPNTGLHQQQGRPVEKFGHQPRLYELTLQIGEGHAYDDDVVFAAAWLHDIGVFSGHRPEDPAALARWENTAYAVGKVPGLLNEVAFPAAQRLAVVEAICTHQPTGIRQ